MAQPDSPVALAVIIGAQGVTGEVRLKLFTDDLEQALEESGETERLFLGEKNENPKTEAAILAYLYRNVAIEENGKATAWEFIGKEADIDACWSYLQVNNVRKIKSLKVINTSLAEISPKQTHMVNVHVNGTCKCTCKSTCKMCMCVYMCKYIHMYMCMYRSMYMRMCM